MPQGAVLLDGEINDNHLLNRPIGLFEVGKTQEAVYNGSTEFLPDLLFYSAALEFRSSEVGQKSMVTIRRKTQKIIRQKFLARLLRIELRKEKGIKKWDRISISERFDLCPVTRSIIRRHMRATSPRIFIAYSHADRAFAERLEQDLTSRSIKVWRDAKKLAPTVSVDLSIKRALEDSSHLLFLASGNSVASEFACNEVQYASDLGRPRIAVMLEDLKPRDTPLAMTRCRRIDFRDRRQKERYQKSFEELVQTLFLREDA
jgi:hypothetical protein